MAIRLRECEGRLIALCAARSIAKDGDVYLDDRVHHALSAKFHADLLVDADGWPEHALMEVEESDNPARAEWDRTYG